MNITSPISSDLSPSLLQRGTGLPPGMDRLISGKGSFGDALNQQAALNHQAIASGPLSEQQTQEQAKKQAEKAATGLVANALILPILQQIRRSPFGEKSIFTNGKAEKAFGPQFDMEIADRIAASPRLGIKQALAAKLLKRTGATPATTGIDVHG